MKIEDIIKNEIYNSLISLNTNISKDEILLTFNKNNIHGDYSCNVALKYANKFGYKPIELAKEIVNKINKEKFIKVEAVIPGFINFYIKTDEIYSIIDKVLNENENYGQQENKNITYNIEYVSANPTGDLHLGHARGAALGDSISRIFKKAGFNVIREYYINDAGAQVENLGKSIKSRYLELFNIKYDIPKDGYIGEDIKIIAKEFKKIYKDKYIDIDDSNLDTFKEFGIKKELEKIKNDLKEFRVEFDVFTSENSIRQKYPIKEYLESIKNYTYTLDGALFLKTSEFLDDKDRALIKSSGEYTYFLPDILYHLDKKSRNADFLIDILGSDHHGYINRLKSALMINGLNKNTLEVEMTQMVRIIKDGQEVKMSKRLGNAIKMRELVNLVGVDACRYFFVARSSNSHLDFDLDIALANNSSNPVYYCQYAYARIQSILSDDKILINSNYELLNNDLELQLMKILTDYDKIIIDASNERAPYKICNYTYNLASKIHEYYAKYKVNNTDEVILSGARKALLKACSIVLKDSLNLIGVFAPNKM